MKNKLGENVHNLCKQRGISQRSLAEQIGITEVALSRYINGSRTPKVSTLSKIAEALNTTVSDLLGEEKNTDEKTVYLRSIAMSLMSIAESLKQMGRGKE